MVYGDWEQKKHPLFTGLTGNDISKRIQPINRMPVI
jgi:hypothetical protein